MRGEKSAEQCLCYAAAYLLAQPSTAIAKMTNGPRRHTASSPTNLTPRSPTSTTKRCAIITTELVVKTKPSAGPKWLRQPRRRTSNHRPSASPRANPNTPCQSKTNGVRTGSNLPSPSVCHRRHRCVGRGAKMTLLSTDRIGRSRTSTWYTRHRRDFIGYKSHARDCEPSRRFRYPVGEHPAHAPHCTTFRQSHGAIGSGSDHNTAWP